MDGLMMDYQLTLPSLLRRVVPVHPEETANASAARMVVAEIGAAIRDRKVLLFARRARAYPAETHPRSPM